MSDIKITDLVSQETIDNIKELNTEMQALLTTYTNVAKDLARGVDVPVKVVGDIDKLEKLLVEKTKEAAAATEKLNAIMSEQSRVVANTTNTISRQLMEQEKVNKTQREAYTEYDKVKSLLEQYNDSYDDHVKRLVQLDVQLKANKKSQKDNEDAFKAGKKSIEDYRQTQTDLIATQRFLTQEKRTLTQIMTAEEKSMQTAEGSYVQLSQQLELLKKAYKDLGPEAREGIMGKEMESAIQNLDAHLKDLAADMGEFQRNVGNYAIAGQNGVVSTESLNAVLNQQAVTIQDVADQTKILEESRRMLDTSDANYAQTLAAIDSQLAANKATLSDVSDIMDKDATTAAEAEAQNRRLSEALKYVDLSAADAQQKIDALGNKIEANNAVIERSSTTTEKKAKAEKEAAEAAKKLAEEEKKAAKEAEDLKKKNEGLADSMLNMIGINANLGSSFKEMGEGGSVFDGLNTKVTAFGKTLMGLLANPWVLAFLGITGIVAGFKWWYDYNKGLIEASRLTENFTGATGDAADKVTADMQTLADKMGKGYSDTIGAANTLVQQFGMSWDEAYELMKDGITAGADMSGNMIANIERFAPALRDAGVSADEFMAILAETRNGIFNEDGIQNIMKAGTRLRAMTKQTEQSLNDVGISAKQMQKDLESGNITMLEAVQQVSAKLKEIPENSQEAGSVMKNVFGRTASEGGALLLQSIADINTSLDKAKDNMGELGKVNEEQMNAQRELNEVLMAVFKMSGTNFEIMTTRAKTFITKGLTGIIKGCADIVNWFINMYNESSHVRVQVAMIIAVFKSLWTVAKAAFDVIINGFKNTGTAIEGVMLILSGEFETGLTKIKSAFSNGWDNIKNIAINAGKEIGANFADEINNAAERRLKPVNISLEGEDVDGPNRTSTPRTNPTAISGGGDDKDAKKKAKEADKAAKEELKRLQALEESKIAIMEDGHEKELATIRLKFKKKLDEIKGEGETQTALRIQLAEQCENEVADCELKYQRQLSKINQENRLATLDETSKEYLDIKLSQIEAERLKELEETQRSGADVALIEEKFNAKRLKQIEDFNKKKQEAIQKEYADEQSKRDVKLTMELASLKKEYAQKLSESKLNSKQRENLEKEYNDKVAAIQRQYAEDTARRIVEMLEKVVAAEDLSAEQRIEAERKLKKAKADLEDAMAQNTIDTINETSEKTTGTIQKWWDDMDPTEKINFILDQVSKFADAFNELASALYDGQIERLEEMQDALSESSEKEIERITELVEKKVITEEEGEARKRAAEAQTAKKSEELEKKKQQLQYKQAVWDKANSLVQAAISTAMGITTTIGQLGMPAAIPMIALVSALGAIQMATIAATPIPKYAKGTDNHPGGPAIVGDGGRHEVVFYNGGAWLTPDTPTLVDMPRGAVVIPNANDFDGMPFTVPIIPVNGSSPIAPIGYDDKNMRRGVAELAHLIRIQTKQQHVDSIESKYELFKLKI